MTKSETMLWWALRDQGIGVKFRRQVPIGQFTVDFASHEVHLIIEIDGRTHDSPEARAYDWNRQDWLEKQGWRVLRFQDELVIGGLPIVVERIKAVCPARGISDIP